MFDDLFSNIYLYLLNIVRAENVSIVNTLIVFLLYTEFRQHGMLSAFDFVEAAFYRMILVL